MHHRDFCLCRKHEKSKIAPMKFNGKRNHHYIHATAAKKSVLPLKHSSDFNLIFRLHVWHGNAWFLMSCTMSPHRSCSICMCVHLNYDIKCTSVNEPIKHELTLGGEQQNKIHFPPAPLLPFHLLLNIW